MYILTCAKIDDGILQHTDITPFKTLDEARLTMQAYAESERDSYDDENAELVVGEWDAYYHNEFHEVMWDIHDADPKLFD